MTLNEKIQLARDDLENAMESVPTSTKQAFLRLSKLLTELDERESNNQPIKTISSLDEYIEYKQEEAIRNMKTPDSEVSSCSAVSFVLQEWNDDDPLKPYWYDDDQYEGTETTEKKCLAYVANDMRRNPRHYEAYPHRIVRREETEISLPNAK